MEPTRERKFRGVYVYRIEVVTVKPSQDLCGKRNLNLLAEVVNHVASAFQYCTLNIFKY